VRRRRTVVGRLALRDHDEHICTAGRDHLAAARSGRRTDFSGTIGATRVGRAEGA
jgi:hypothetical protein